MDIREITFENTVAGETVKKSITVKNTGALSTDFTFNKLLGKFKLNTLEIFTFILKFITFILFFQLMF